jgi:hypothetical protein
MTKFIAAILILFSAAASIYYSTHAVNCYGARLMVANEAA